MALCLPLSEIIQIEKKYMNLEQLADKYLPYTKEERGCAIKKAQKKMLRDSFMYDIGVYFSAQLTALQKAQTPKKEYG